jgi:long-chain acyl-CoA synthetase
MMPSQMPWLATYPKGIDWQTPIVPQPVYTLLAATRATHGDRPAFDFLGKNTTWAEIGQMVDHLATGLQAQGYGKADRIGIMLPNCPMFLVAYYAIARIGATIVNFNPLYAERELIHQINDSQISLMITSDLKVLYDKTFKVWGQTNLKRVLICPFTDMLPFPKNLLFPIFKGRDRANIAYDGRHLKLADIMRNDGVVRDMVIDPARDVALLQYTGGTTGTPKGAMLTHANITGNAQQCALWFTDCKPGHEKMLGVIPFFHVFAMTAVMNLSVLKGLHIIATPRFDLDETMRVINDKKPTLFPAVPAIFNAINHHPHRKNYDLRSLRHCISGGAPLPVEVKKAFEGNTGCTLVEGYGLTETSPVTHVNPLFGVNKPGSIGLPLPGTLVEVVDIHDRTRVLPLGEKGEICITGPQVMAGYWGKKDETAKVLVNGRLHTGDIGYIDPDGYTFIVDRLKDMIITNGYNVYPRNVEEAIYMHPDVEECIVAGIPDTDRGERVKAWIKMKPLREISGEVMKGFLRDKLSPMEIPREFEFRDTPLPKTLIGKLSRKDVVAQELARRA